MWNCRRLNSHGHLQLASSHSVDLGAIFHARLISAVPLGNTGASCGGFGTDVLALAGAKFVGIGTSSGSA